MSTLTVSIRDLHSRTGHFVRKAYEMPVIITDNGKPVAEIKPLGATRAKSLKGGSGSYWAKRKLLPEFAALAEDGKLRPKAGDKSMDEILDEIKADANL